MPRKIEFLTDNAIGLDGIFNTCRLGIKWHEAVNPGTPLDLVVVDEQGNKQIFGTATVIGKIFGEYQNLAPLHAAYSHVALHDGLSGIEAAQQLEVGLGKAYGERFNPGEAVTFLYMIRTDTHEGGRDRKPYVVGNDPAAAVDD